MEINDYLRTKSAVQQALNSIIEHVSENKVKLPDIEKQWLNRYIDEIENLADDENEALDHVSGLYGTMFLKEAYGL